MKKILFLTAVALSSFASAQFKLQGKIENYNNKTIMVKTYDFSSELESSTKTDGQGNFTLEVKKPYSGILAVTLMEAKNSFGLIAENKDLTIGALLADNGEIYLNKCGNDISEKFQQVIQYNGRKDLEKGLEESIAQGTIAKDKLDEAKKIIKESKEMQVPNTANYPLLTDYVEGLKVVSETTPVKGEDSILEEKRNKIADYIVNAGDVLEKTDIGEQLFTNYFLLSGSKSNGELEGHLDKLINSVDIETSRGQAILASAIELSSSYDLDKIFKKYIDKAANLNCQISDDLKSTLTKNNAIQVGKTIPNVELTKNLTGYNKLHDIKAKYKIIVISGSWCGFCKREMPKLKEFYPEFKKMGGEIIGLGVEASEADWRNYINGAEWINDSQMLMWDSSYVKTLNVTGTPTMFLVDKNNKILVIGNTLESIKAKFK